MTGRHGEPRLPFFVYGTLRAGRHNHDLYLRGSTAAEEPARLRGALLYEGPGYPYAVEGDGVVTGELVTAAPDRYGGLVAALDRLEEYFGPGDPRSLFVRVERTVHTASGGVSAWVYLAAGPVARELRAKGTPIPGGDWSARD
ncbi:gamma-glutamylcyclotransferase family protein [Streptomyces tirandamycinicus]|uniref:gamma-glutamylcyclotransferase family protein n=1 Tax=Streptomyces tirandamycinicus TaxID=2174846 RepID=UPI002271BB56|nr:gamma-glutamylcyclotransferase family protein [Streptomyces tirandamycinicus]MCY0980622.1 gamma-glutamylcyclotransferase [Streptomyces tirandamycinicus]